VDDNKRTSGRNVPHLKKNIFIIRISKMQRLVDGKPQYVRMGQGEVPIFEAVDALSKVDIKVITVLNGKNFGTPNSKILKLL
jgi:hypothetical protein